MEQDRRLSVVLRVGLLVLFFWMVRGILVPVALGGLFALLLSPVLGRIQPRLGRARDYAPLILTLGTLVLVVIPFVFIAIEAVQSINFFLARDWSPIIARVQSFLTEGFYIRGRTIHIGGPELQAAIQDIGQRLATYAANSAGGVAAAVPHIMLSLFLFAVGLYYFLRDGKALVDWLFTQSPFPDEQTHELFASVRETVNGAILGIIATAIVQGGLTYVALNVFKVPNASLLAILAMMLSVIPLIGTTPVTVGSTIYLFVTGKFGSGIGMLIAIVVIGLSDNIVRPWVQSSRTHIHPLVVLLGIFGGLEMFGAVGVFLGPVVAAMAVWSVETYAKYHPARRLTLPPQSSVVPPVQKSVPPEDVP
jgi:predicted PurR-regulated permease PerM